MPRLGLLLPAAFLLAIGGLATPAAADEPRPAAAPLNIESLTTGGMQFWGDELVFRGWRIQRSTVTGHCRLLDEDDHRQAWGTYDQCAAKLAEIKRDQKLPPLDGPAVVLVHGLFRNRAAMQPLGDYLAKHGKYTIINFGYPSTQRDVAAIAAQLDKVLERLEGADELYLVGHSLGNIVIRHYLGDHTDDKAGRRPDPRIKRIVMLGPPNHGSLIAETLGENVLFQIVTGRNGQLLGVDWETLAPRLATPRCPFGVIAGGLDDGKGFNPLLEGDDDGTVTVTGTQLAGAADFLVAPVRHSRLMRDEKIQAATLRFLRDGHFVAADKRRPLPEAAKQ